MRTLLSIIAAPLALAASVSRAPVIAAQSDGTLSLPLRLSAFAINMSGSGARTTAVVDIRITRWSTAAERERLITTATEKNQDALLRELQKMPDHGRISIPGWTGTDPHNVRLGWQLHYTWSTPGEDGGQRIGIATDRYIGFWEARNQPRTTDYPFTLIEMRLDNAGKGVGKMAVATKIEFDKEKKQMVLENYGIEPVRLNEIKIDK